MQNSLIKLSRFLLSNLALTTTATAALPPRTEADSAALLDKPSPEWFLSQALVRMINLGWASVTASYKCLETLSVITLTTRQNWFTNITGTTQTVEPLRLCYEGYEMLYRVSEEIMGRISGSLKKADKKSPVHKALKQAYRTKILHLEASIIDLRREGEVTKPVPTNATSAVAANIIRGVGVGVGVVTDVKKEPKF